MVLFLEFHDVLGFCKGLAGLLRGFLGLLIGLLWMVLWVLSSWPPVIPEDKEAVNSPLPPRNPTQASALYPIKP